MLIKRLNEFSYDSCIEAVLKKMLILAKRLYYADNR